MLTLRKSKEYYIVECSTESGQQINYHFNSEHLSEKALIHLEQLTVFNTTHSTTFALSKKQDAAFMDVLQKLREEQHSAYLFSVQLQKTYLFELIHLITKIHLTNLPLFE